MKAIYQNTILLSLLLFISSLANGQCMYIPLSIAQRVAQSQIIVEGTVTQNVCFQSPSNERIYTASTIWVSKILKGALPDNKIILIELGGSIGDKTLLPIPSLKLTPGETGLFFCTPSNIHDNQAGVYFEAYGLEQGFVKYSDEPNTGYDVLGKYELASLNATIQNLTGQAVTDINSVTTPNQTKQLEIGPQITSFSPDSLSAGTLSLLTIKGSGFGTLRGTGIVSFNYMNNNGQYIDVLPGEYQLWTDTLIKVYIPTGAGSGPIKVTQGTAATSPLSLIIPYSMVTYVDSALSKEFPIELANLNSNGGYNIYMNDSMAYNSAAESPFLRALNTWRCHTKVNWNYAGLTAATSSSGATNVAYFDNLNPLPAGILGQLLWNFEYCGTGNNLQSYLSYFDLVMHTGIDWCYGHQTPNAGQYDIETVFLHELGHAHMLGHVVTTEDFMHSSTAAGAVIRNLSIGNLAGGNYEMSISTPLRPCGQASMTDYTQACNTAGVSDVKATELRVFPNPFSDQIFINQTEVGATIKVFDLIGNCVLDIAAKSETMNIDTHHLEAGLYLIQYIVNNQRHTYKMVKN